MGTRNLTMVVEHNEFRVSQYGQWDGYPSGQGQTVVDFLKNEYNFGRIFTMRRSSPTRK